jgi:hypothetical protein
MAIQDCVSQPIAGTSCRVPLYEGSAPCDEPGFARALEGNHRRAWRKLRAGAERHRLAIWQGEHPQYPCWMDIL